MTVRPDIEAAIARFCENRDNVLRTRTLARSVLDDLLLPAHFGEEDTHEHRREAMKDAAERRRLQRKDPTE